MGDRRALRVWKAAPGTGDHSPSLPSREWPRQLSWTLSAPGLRLSVPAGRSKPRRSGSRCEKQGNCGSKEKAVRAEEAEGQLEKKKSRLQVSLATKSWQLMAAGRSPNCGKWGQAAPEPPHGAQPCRPEGVFSRFPPSQGFSMGERGCAPQGTRGSICRWLWWARPEGATGV